MTKSKLLITIAAGLLTLSSAIAAPVNSIPVHRPLMEEYTGAWCGWCVRGLAGMQMLSDTFGDEFIGVAYHNGDAMEIMSESSFPNTVYGLPTAYIDRTSEVDPYFGFGYTSGGIADAMQQFAALEVIAGIDVTAQWTSDDRTAIDVDVTTYFTIVDNSGNYAIQIMLIADDLYGSGSGWNQSNYYSNNNSYANDPYLGPWVSKPSTVKNHHFNDVLVGTSNIISGSLPTTIEAYRDYSTDYTFSLSQLPKPALIQNKDNLHVIAIVVNTNTKVAINANRCFINEYHPVIPGDVNNDGIVNIDDVTTIISYLLGGYPYPINVENADMNGDGKLNVEDMTTIINQLLNKS